MKKVLFLFSFLMAFQGYCQDSLQKQESRRFLSIDQVRKNNIPMTAQDSLNWVFFENDTLVPVDQFPSEAKNQVKFPYEPREEEFLKLYKQAVFGHTEEYQKKSTLKIWKDGLRFYFDPSVPETHRKKLLDFSEKIASGIDSLKITEVQERANSNFLIFYRNSEEDLDQEPRVTNERSSGYYVNWNSYHQLTHGAIKINAYQIEHEDHQLNLLKYHFFKALGYFHFSPEISCKSYLSGCPVKREITPIDLEILKYHYSYGMCKGINLKTFEDIHKNAKAALQKHPKARFYLVHQI